MNLHLFSINVELFIFNEPSIKNGLGGDGKNDKTGFLELQQLRSVVVSFAMHSLIK